MPGIGAKTATRLIHEYESIENLRRNLASITPDKTRQLIATSIEQALQNEKLATLEDDLALEAPLVSALTDRAIANVRSLFETLEFKSLLVRLDASLKPKQKPPENLRLPF